MTLIDEATLAACSADDADEGLAHQVWSEAFAKVKNFDEWEEVMEFAWEFDDSGKWAVALCDEFGAFEIIRAVRDGDVDEDDVEWERATTSGWMEQSENGLWQPVPGLTWGMVLASGFAP